MIYSCREIYKSIFKYTRWENFDNMIKKMLQLNKIGVVNVNIVESTKIAKLGSGATRKIGDYLIDDKSIDVLSLLCPNKNNLLWPVRNETIIVGLLKKYFESKGFKFETQKHIGNFIADAVVDNRVIFEFDEPYHLRNEIVSKDSIKDNFYFKSGYKVCRSDVKDDVIDIILNIEKKLFDENGTVL